MMIETCFQINKSRTIEACNILLNVFSDQNVREYVEAQINLVWDKLESNVEVFLPVFQSLSFGATDTNAFVATGVY